MGLLIVVPGKTIPGLGSVCKLLGAVQCVASAPEDGFMLAGC